jgi:hypothetical protein
MIEQGTEGRQQTDDQLWLAEWKECRVTIDRFDKIIVDIRKHGFVTITAFLTAGAFLSSKLPDLELTDGGKCVVAGVIILLTCALFLVDRCHEVFLRSAVERAQELEGKMKMQLTSRIGRASLNPLIDTWGIWAYVLFLAVAALSPVATSISSWDQIPAHEPFVYTLLGEGVVSIVFVLGYHLLANNLQKKIASDLRAQKEDGT